MGIIGLISLFVFTSCFSFREKRTFEEFYQENITSSLASLESIFPDLSSDAIHSQEMILDFASA